VRILANERHILVTNDDGIEAPGLWKLAEVMAEVGTVLVVAPATDASGSGTMVNYRRELQVQEVPERLPGVRAYMVDGSPADCVLIGLRRLKLGWISIVAAGINPGANIAADLYLSGTCGAALMAAFRQITTFAVSIALEGSRDGNPHWETAEEMSRRVARGIVDGSVPEGAFLNVNVPALSLDAIKGVAITHPAPGGYMHLEERGDGTNERVVREIKPDLRHAHEGTDIRAVVDGYVSISPLSTALAHPEHAEHLRSNASVLFGEPANTG
jgi:5'-nucleotidase